MPLFVWLPILLLGVCRAQLTPQRLRVLLALSGTIAVSVLVAAPGRLFLTEPLHKNEVLNTPFRRLARDLRPDIRLPETLIVQDRALAGNLRLWFPEKLVVCPEVAPLFPRPPGRCELSWRSAHPRQTAVVGLALFDGPRTAEFLLDSPARCAG